MRFGDIEITRVSDYEGPSFPPEVMFAAFRPEHLAGHRDWLVPGFIDASGRMLQTSIHSWLVRTPRHCILVDTCIGNHKRRPSIARFDMRDEPWIERLAAAGAAPEDVDFVMCTHLHADHVGWNTRLQDGRWMPTFPNAKYLFTRTEFSRWDERDASFEPRPINENVFADSILPVVESRQMLLVDEGHTVDDCLTVEAAPGHTPGHAAIRLAAGGRQAVFSGDVIHHPIQLAHPDLCSVFDEEPERALQTRRRLLNDCADRGVALLPTHFASPYCCHLRHDGQGGYRPLFDLEV